MPAHAAAAPAPFGPAVACALLAGVLLVQRWPALPPAGVAGVALVAAFLAWRRDGTWRIAGALLAGMALASLHAGAALEARWPLALDRSTAWVTGDVASLPVPDEDARRFDLRVIDGEGEAARLAGRRVRVSWFTDDAPPPVQAGSRWRLKLRLRAPVGHANPGGFDLERHAVSQGVAALAHVVSPAAAVQWRAGEGLPAWRERLAARIAASAPADSERFVRALALGDTRGLDEGDWDILRITGLTHLIAISGFHVGLVAGFGALLARAAWWAWPTLARRLARPAAAALCALAAAAAYTALAGFALPTVRTLLMIGVVALARMLRRSQGGAQSLALAVIAILLVDPLAVLAPGFWLSVLGVAWLLWCLPGAEPAWRGLLRAQGVATLGLLPLTAWFFQQASLVGPLANLAGIPWISLVVVPLSLAGLALSPLHEGLATFAWTAAGQAMAWLWRGLETAAGWPLAFAWLPEPGLPALLLALAAAFWWTLPRGTPGKPLATLLWLPLLWPAPIPPPPGQVEFVQLDVGQGLAVLVRTHRHALLYDAGPAPPRGLDAGEAVVLPSLRALGVRRLDLLVISHGDNDHAGGAGSVRRGLPVARVLAPRGWAHGAIAPCLAGERWTWDGVEFELRHPPLPFRYRGNESSCVLLVRTGAQAALLPGDIGRHVEARLAREGGLGADVLFVPHHGSEGSSSLDLLAAVRPRLALLSAGRGNRFDLPSPRALARYARYDVPVLDSASHGAISLRLGPGAPARVGLFRRDRPRWWRHAGGPSGYAIGGTEPPR